MNLPLKRTLAVLAGFVTVAALSIATDTALEAAGVLPPIDTKVPMSTGQLALALAYRSAFAVFGGWVTACLSPLPERMRDVKILAWLGLAGGVAGVFAGWNLSQHWYPIALAVTAWPLVYWGGTLHRPASSLPPRQ